MTVVNTAFAKSGGTASSFSFSFDATGANYLLIAVAFDDSVAHTFDSVEYDSVAATPSASVEDASGRSIYTFFLANPATGSNTLLIDWSSSFAGVTVGVLALSGTNLASPITGTGTAGGAGASISIPTITSTANDTVYAFGYLNNEAIGDVTEGADQTLVAENGLTSGVMWISSKSGAETSQSMAWTNTSQSYGVVALSISPASTATVTAPSSTTFGDTMTISTSGLSALTTATLTDSASNIFNITVTNDTTLDVPAIAAALDACLYGTVTLTVGDGTDTATTTLDFDPPAGYTLTTLASLAGTPSYVDEWTTAAEVGDQIIENSARLTLNDDGSYSATGDTEFSAVTYVTSKTGGEITQVTYNFLGEGGGSVRNLTSSKLTSVKLTSNKLTASKL